MLEFVDVPMPPHLLLPGEPAVRRMKAYGDAGYGASDVIERPYVVTDGMVAEHNFNVLMSRVR
eukprot:55534-Eustigmatos_ZCMA.PRE.1